MVNEDVEIVLTTDYGFSSFNGGPVRKERINKVMVVKHNLDAPITYLGLRKDDLTIEDAIAIRRFLELPLELFKEKSFYLENLYYTFVINSTGLLQGFFIHTIIDGELYLVESHHGFGSCFGGNGIVAKNRSHKDKALKIIGEYWGSPFSSLNGALYRISTRKTIKGINAQIIDMDINYKNLYEEIGARRNGALKVKDVIKGKVTVKENNSPTLLFNNIDKVTEIHDAIMEHHNEN